MILAKMAWRMPQIVTVASRWEKSAPFLSKLAKNGSPLKNGCGPRAFRVGEEPD